MGAYDDYKIITDNSAADFQNTVAKHVGQGFKQLEANAEKRRKIKEQLKIENHRRNANQIKFNNADSNAAFEFGQAFKGPDNQFSDSLNESFSSTLSMINSLKVKLDDKNITPKDSLAAQAQLVIQNNVLNSIKDEQSTYIGTSGAAKEKVKDTAGLDTSYSYTGVGEDNDEDAAQDIYNNLAGNPVAEGNSLVRNPDSSVTAKGTYSSNEEGGEGTKYNVEFSPSEWKKFSEKPTYDLLNSAVSAVNNISPGLFASDGTVDPLMVQNKPADAKEIEKIQSLDITEEEKANKISELTTTYGTETTVDTIIPGDNPKIQTETRKSLSQEYINSLVDPEILSQTSDFKVSTKAQQLKQLTALGLPKDEWEKYSSSDIATTRKFWKTFDEALKEDVDEGLMRKNPKFKKDENEDWYFSSNIKTKDAEKAKEPTATEEEAATLRSRARNTINNTDSLKLGVEMPSVFPGLGVGSKIEGRNVESIDWKNDRVTVKYNVKISVDAPPPPIIVPAQGDTSNLSSTAQGNASNTKTELRDRTYHYDNQADVRELAQATGSGMNTPNEALMFARQFVNAYNAKNKVAE